MEGKVMVNDSEVIITDIEANNGVIHVIDTVLLPEEEGKSIVEIAVEDGLLDKTTETITSTASTGKIGDGKIFVLSIEQAIRIRTGETGDAAV